MDGVATFDEINKLGIKRKSEEYTDYFSDMDLNDVQKNERISFSKDTEDVLMLILGLIAIQKAFDSLDREYAIYQLETQYRAVVASYTGIDEYLETYIQDFSSAFVDTTYENINDIWFISEDRAMFDAENEANTTLNYKDYLKAILSGKTMKTWKTYGDSRVRKTHKPLDGKTIPIKDLFIVGNSFMRFPKDTMYGANLKETVNCRCSVSFS